MHKSSYYIVNAITLYRLVSVIVLLYFIFSNQLAIFRWLLVVSFFTDALDGFLARKFRVTSANGSMLDSIADDLTVLMAIIGVIVFKPGFIRHEIVLIIVLLALYLTQTTVAFIHYRKISTFHTILAKGATLLQGVFLMLIFFLPSWPLWLFHMAAVITILDLLEEIVLAIILPKDETDVKGLYWIVKSLNQMTP